eukprot:TRINITY_DN25096_c0_g6_i1.p1 TRINITY_DN25096_c0_g6~~TRINITY_DN25096_c0_g6_i1.p1  ORF type:complete len:364 (+),score=64.68 TRINITY_DN25096_c0_g6_i1:35-1093(+)
MVSPQQRQQWEAEQRKLAELRVEEDRVDWTFVSSEAGAAEACSFPGLERIAGVDVSFFGDGTYAVATVVVLRYPKLTVLFEKSACFRLAIPYVPGFLAFREVPALTTLLRQVPRNFTPQVILVDGNGAFHPRRCGAATHLGVSVDLPTIGVAKEVMRVDEVNTTVARQVAESLQCPGDMAPLGPLAVLLRPGSGKKTLVVSSGHRVSLNTSAALTAALCTASSLPEPIRQADHRSRRCVQAWYNGEDVEYLEAPRLQHLQLLLKLGKDPSCKSQPSVSTTSSACRRGKRTSGLTWRVKETVSNDQDNKEQKEIHRVKECSNDDATSRQDTQKTPTLSSYLFGWLCECFTRES